MDSAPEESKVALSTSSSTALPPPYKVTPKKLFDKKPQGHIDQDIKKDYEDQLAEYSQMEGYQLTAEGVQEYRDAMVYPEEKWEQQFRDAIKACHQQSFTVPQKYGNDAYVRVLVQRPKSLPAKNNAAVIFAHGGGAVGSCPEDNVPYVSYLANKSNVVGFTIKYRLAPQAKAHQMISDMYVVVKHVYENCEELGINPKQIAIQGDSGGGYVCMGTAAMLALKNQSEMVKLMIAIQPMSTDYFITQKKEDMSMLAKFCLYDTPFVVRSIATNLQEQLKERDPILFPALAKDQVMAKYPPTFLIESEFDHFVEPTNRFAERMGKLGRLNEYVSYPGAHHGFYCYAKYKRTAEFWNDFKMAIDEYLKN